MLPVIRLRLRMQNFFFQAEDGIRDGHVTGVQTCALPILPGSVKVWELATGKELHSFDGFAVFFAVAFSPDGKRLAAGGADKKEKRMTGSGGFAVWDLATGVRERVIACPRVFSLAFTPAGDELVAAGAGGVSVWNLAQCTERTRFSAHPNHAGSSSGAHR